MHPFQSRELLDLFTVYTGTPTGIGPQLAHANSVATARDPLIVATASDFVLYPGSGQPPVVEGFRLSTRGFHELAAVSHLGPALAALTRLKGLDAAGPWHDEAERLLDATRAARAANSVGLWRDHIAVAAFVGREQPIANMIDYACALTEQILRRALDDPAYLSFDTLRRDFLHGDGEATLPVPFDRIMVATFFLTGLDVAHRLLTWFDGLNLPWERTLVIIAGRQGRPTAGVTVETNSIAGIVSSVARGRLPHTHLLVAPHAPVFPMFDGTGMEAIQDLEPVYRELWSSIRVNVDLAALMFDDSPRYVPRSRSDRFNRETTTVSDMPPIAAPDDWYAMITRLRLVMEDPRQLLSGAVTDYATAQLIACGNLPASVVVPGLDRERYEALS